LIAAQVSSSQRGLFCGPPDRGIMTKTGRRPDTGKCRTATATHAISRVVLAETLFASGGAASLGDQHRKG